MTTLMQSALQAWEFPIWPTLALLLTAVVYVRGWLRLRDVTGRPIPEWRAGSFLSGVFLIWVAIGSPLAAFDEQSLTVHMLQHLLLMTIAPPLIWLGAPMMPFLHGLPQVLVARIIGPLLRWPPIYLLGRALAQPALCWLAAAAALIGWHVPAAFTLALHSENWHIAEHISFLASGLLFWWPVILPWPSPARSPRWSVLLYLFLATVPCDVLSGFLVFSDRIVYPVYLSQRRQFGLSVLTDQECAGALMWTSVTIIYLIAGALIAMQLLSSRSSRHGEWVES
jgi:putative membrane protein